MSERWEVRAEFGALLNAELIGNLGLVQVTYSYKAKDSAGLSPAVMLGSGGTRRIPFTTKGGSYSAYLINLTIYVMYAEIGPDAEGGSGELVTDPDTGLALFDENSSEMKLDQIEAAVLSLIDRNQRGAAWKSIGLAGDTSTELLTSVGGQSWRGGHVPLLFNVF